MRIIALLLSVFLIINCQAQKEFKFNLNFEEHNDTNGLADGWISWGSYEINKSSLSIEGANSVKLTYSDSSEFGCVAFPIPANYHGEKIKLEGYMKTKNVVDGFAGLYLHIADENNSKNLLVDNMQEQNISGTTAWTKYTIEHDFPEDATTFYIGGILNGKGEVWFDDFTLTIDGKNIQYLEVTKTALSKITLDKEFDEGSKVIIPELTPELINGIEVLGRVWGFLKYYHPAVAKGKYNWDYELFRFMPSYLAESDNSIKEELLLNWINSLGKVKKCRKCDKPSENVYSKVNHEWINNSINNDSLKETLLYVYYNRNQGSNAYFNEHLILDRIIFNKEDAYSDMHYPDCGYRVLSLFRYWNIINYFFPSKYLCDKDWDTVLTEYIPVFVNAKNTLEYELAALQVVAEINDTHATFYGGKNYIQWWKGYYKAPVELKFIEGKLIVTKYIIPKLKEELGLEIGDVITKIDNKNVEDIIVERSKYYPASNPSVQLRDMSKDMLRSSKKEIEIEYINDGKIGTKTIKLVSLYDNFEYKKENKTKNKEKSYKLLDNNIGYITLATIKYTDIHKIKRALKNTDGIIIDIRNYPKSFIPKRLGSFFVSEKTPFVRLTHPNLNNLGEFVYFKRIGNLRKSRKAYKGKLIVIVNEETQSQAEFTAMALRAGDNTTIIGSTTAGADGDVCQIILPGGLSSWYSGLGIYYPNGEQTQRIGIIPDIVVKPTIEGIKSGRDELLEKAIELILEK